MLSGDRNNQNEFFIASLNADVIRYLCRFLIVEDIIAFMAVCHQAHHIKHSPFTNKLWKKKLALHFPSPDDDSLETGHYGELVKRYRYTRKGNFSRLFSIAKEGDIESTAAIFDSMYKPGDRRDELQHLHRKDVYGNTPLDYARNYGRKDWLDYCYKNEIVTLNSGGFLQYKDDFQNWLGIRLHNQFYHSLPELAAISQSLQSVDEFDKKTKDILQDESFQEFLYQNPEKEIYLKLRQWLFFMAVICGHLDLLKGQPIDTPLLNCLRDGIRPLGMAMIEGNREVVALLKAAGSASPFYNNRNPNASEIRLAIQRNNLDAIDMILEHFPAIRNTDGVMHTLAIIPHVSMKVMMRFLPEKTDTPWHVFSFEAHDVVITAIRERNINFMKALFKQQPQLLSDPIMAGNFLRGILHQTRHIDYESFGGTNLRFLMKSGFDFGCMQNEYSPLMLILRHGAMNDEKRVRFLKFFIDNHIRVDGLTESGFTVLYHLATCAYPLRNAAYHYIAVAADPSKKAALQVVVSYISQRHDNSDNYFGTLFGFNFGFSRNQKLAAADALLRVILSNEVDLSLLDDHKEALTQGELGGIFRSQEVQQFLTRRIHTEQDLDQVKFKL